MTSTSSIAIDAALRDVNLLGSGLGPIETWSVWETVLKAAFALPLSDTELEVFHSVAGDRTPPTKRVRELWVTAGRRGGKSRIAAACAVYHATCVTHRLSPGEVGVVLCIAASREQAAVVHGYALGYLNASPVLRNEVESVTRSEIKLKSGIVIAIHANSFRQVRGRSACAVVLDEVSFWRDDSTATPDIEVYRALLPSLLTTNGMLIGISSPYRRLGLMYSKFKQHHGVDSADVLCVRGGTLVFNQTLDELALELQRQADPLLAKSEYDAEYRSDISTFLDDELVEHAIDRDRPPELPPRSAMHYRGFVDPSGGSAGGDRYTLAIGHRQDGRYVIDVVRARQGPFDPAATTRELAEACKQYRISSVTGDRYAAEWTSSAWRSCGISYVASERTASELYRESLVLWTRSQVSIPDLPALTRELRLLERQASVLGRETISHPKGTHDDLANACCGCLVQLASHLGDSAYLEALSGAIDDDAAPSSAVLALQERARERRHRELMQRYGAPISMLAPDLIPPHLQEAFQRARQSAWEARYSDSTGGDNGQA